MPHGLLFDFLNNENKISMVMMEKVCKIAIRCAKDLGFESERVRIDCLSLYAALERYSRDAFGFQRVHNLLEKRFDSLYVGLIPAKQEALLALKNDIQAELKNSGIRIPSANPYVHKKCAFLLYHLIIAKPFYIAGQVEEDITGERTAYFNANVGVCVVNVLLASCEGHSFRPSKNLLRDLTHRLLSRSALEAIMEASI